MRILAWGMKLGEKAFLEHGVWIEICRGVSFRFGILEKIAEEIV